MDDYYITSEIVVKKQKLYFLKNEEKNKITMKNWQKYLADIGWRKIDNKWIRKLNKYSLSKNSGYKWGMRSCGLEGDCLFEAIAEAFNFDIYYDSTNTKDFIYDSSYIREKVSDCLTNNNFEQIITLYRIGYINGEYSNQWNPYMIENVNDLKKELIKNGENFVGDHIILELMASAFNINIIILTNNNDCICQKFNKNIKTIILYYNQDEEDFKLVGYYNKRIKTIFNFDEIPIEIKTINNLFDDCLSDNYKLL